MMFRRCQIAQPSRKVISRITDCRQERVVCVLNNTVRIRNNEPNQIRLDDPAHAGVDSMSREFSRCHVGMRGRQFHSVSSNEAASWRNGSWMSMKGELGQGVGRQPES